MSRTDKIHPLTWAEIRQHLRTDDDTMLDLTPQDDAELTDMTKGKDEKQEVSS